MGRNKDPKKWTWKECEAYRREKEIPLDWLLEELKMSKAFYKLRVDKGCIKRDHEVKLNKYRILLGLHDLDEGNRLMERLDKYVDFMVKKHPGLTKKAWYNNCGLGYNATQIKQQLRLGTRVSFQQVNDILGKLGYKLVVVDMANTRTSLEIRNKEFEKRERRELSEEK